MGKIVGLGGGRFDNGEMLNVAQLIVSLAGKENPVLTFLPTASFDRVSEDDPVIAAFSECGCRTRNLLLTDTSLTAGDIEETIMSSDIIYADGGNLRFLMDTLRKTGADKYLIKAFEKGIVLSGFSSGMMCWFSEGYDDCDDGKFVFIDCLGLLPYSSCPHFESGEWTKYEEKIKGRHYSGYALENGAAYVYTDGKSEAVCGNEGGYVYFFDKEKGHAKEIFGGRPQI